MSPKTLILPTAFLLGIMPLVAHAEPMDHAEAQMFRSATVSLQQAIQIAVKGHNGDLAAVFFNDEDGRGVYEATVVGTDNVPWTVKIDAKTGKVLASGYTAMMSGDHPDSRNSQNGNDEGENDN